MKTRRGEMGVLSLTWVVDDSPSIVLSFGGPSSFWEGGVVGGGGRGLGTEGHREITGDDRLGLFFGRLFIKSQGRCPSVSS